MRAFKKQWRPIVVSFSSATRSRYNSGSPVNEVHVVLTLGLPEELVAAIRQVSPRLRVVSLSWAQRRRASAFFPTFLTSYLPEA